jgi:hypothetical protein
MNERPENDRDDDFAGMAKRRFDESVGRIDGGTQSRLTRARHAALAEAASARLAPQWWLPATGVAGAAVLAVVLWTTITPSPDAGAPALADIEILLTDDSLEMLEDLEFYSWIDLDEESETPQEPENNVG